MNSIYFFYFYIRIKKCINFLYSFDIKNLLINSIKKDIVDKINNSNTIESITNFIISYEFKSDSNINNTNIISIETMDDLTTLKVYNAMIEINTEIMINLYSNKFDYIIFDILKLNLFCQESTMQNKITKCDFYEFHKIIDNYEMSNVINNI